MITYTFVQRSGNAVIILDELSVDAARQYLADIVKDSDDWRLDEAHDKEDE